jgi:hypothetical protein
MSDETRDRFLGLEERITELEKQVADLQSPTTRRHYAKRPSPYDASARRGQYDKNGNPQRLR